MNLWTIILIIASIYGIFMEIYIINYLQKRIREKDKTN